ncbi:MAG: ribosome maturation factor RimP [Tissierellales bacterium]
MKKATIESIISEMVNPILQKFFYELVDVEYIKEGPYFYLRVFIDKPSGVTIDDCQKVSEELSTLLDKEDPIKENYFLEVSSPGLDRPLKKNKDLERSIDKDIEISLYKQISGKKKHIGKLVRFDDNNLFVIDEKNEELQLSRELISKVNLAIKF